MKKLSQLIEAAISDSSYKAKVELSFSLESNNEGEAAFIIEKALSELPFEQKQITIVEIEKENNFQKK